MPATPTALLPTQPASPVLLPGPSLAAAALANAGAAAATAVAATAVTTAATPAATAATVTATTEASMSAGPSGPPAPSAPTQPRAAQGHAAQQHPPRSRRDPDRGDLLALLPGRPTVAYICVTHPLAASAVMAAARDTGTTAQGKGTLKRDKQSRTGTVACRFVPLSHETFGRAGPAAFALLNEIAEFAASSGFVSKRFFLENAMCDLSTTLSRGIKRQVLATVPLCARLNGYPVVAGLPVPTDDLMPIAGGPS